VIVNIYYTICFHCNYTTTKIKVKGLYTSKKKCTITYLILHFFLGSEVIHCLHESTWLRLPGYGRGKPVQRFYPTEIENYTLGTFETRLKTFYEHAFSHFLLPMGGQLQNHVRIIILNSFYAPNMALLHTFFALYYPTVYISTTTFFKFWLSSFQIVSTF